MKNNSIQLNSIDDFEYMRKAGVLAAKILDELQSIIRPGISTGQIIFTPNLQTNH